MQTVINQTLRQFPVIIESDETGGFVVECPYLEGCFSQGDTLDEALTNIKEAIELCLEEQSGHSPAVTSHKQLGIHLVTV